jgi:hypothetical protein
VTGAFALELLAVAFAGGALGAAIGALPSFSLAGLVVIVGELYVLAGRTLGVTELPVDVTGAIGFGPVLGPHVAFGGGAAALAYAARQGYLEGDDSFPAKRVTEGLGSRPDVLAVGGIFGVLGHLVMATSATLAIPVDPVALGVVGSALLHRAALGYSLVGARPGRWLRMEPADGTRADGGTARADPWLPYQTRWPDVTMLGIAGGILGAYVAYLTASPFLAFGISVVALAMLCAGTAKIPVTHHITLPASTAALALVGTGSEPLTPTVVQASVSLPAALAVGAVFGVVGALVGEVLQRVLYAHAETHLDPPAASIVVTSFGIGLLAMAGVLPSAVWVPTP